MKICFMEFCRSWWATVTVLLKISMKNKHPSGIRELKQQQFQWQTHGKTSVHCTLSTWFPSGLMQKVQKGHLEWGALHCVREKKQTCTLGTQGWKMKTAFEKTALWKYWLWSNYCAQKSVVHLIQYFWKEYFSILLSKRDFTEAMPSIIM